MKYAGLKRFLFLLMAFCVTNVPAQCQSIFRAIVTDARTGARIPDVSAWVKDTDLGCLSDSVGKVVITGLADRRHFIYFSVIGYERKIIEVQMPDTSVVCVKLDQDENQLKQVIVSSTRSDKSVDDAPMKVEVVDKEEMQEEQASRPSNVVGVLSDIGGIQVQQTSAVSGNSNIRIQGLDGRYTQMLRDGMPLFDGLSGGFGILQVQPLDLKQIELIKGAASTLYGGGAIGGLINFISKAPSTTQQGELIVNQTSLAETSATLFLAKRYRKLGYTLYAGYTHQDPKDLNGDGLSDIARLKSVNLHPRLYYYPDEKTIITLGFSGTQEARTGGNMQVLEGSTDTKQFYQTNDMTRGTGELLAERRVNDNVKLRLKSSASNFDEVIQTNTHYFSGAQLNYFSEASIFVTKAKYNYTLGIDAVGNRFEKKQSDPTPINNFQNNTVGAFGQLTTELTAKTTMQTGLRLDEHEKYGRFILPTIAVIHHFTDVLSSRIGFGMGYKTPNALDQQTVEYNIEQLLPIGDSVKAEHSYGFSTELRYKKQWDREKFITITSSPFLTEVNDPIIATEGKANFVTFSNAVKPIITRGVDNYIKLQLGELEVYAGYTYTVATREYLQANQFMPLTPMHFAKLTATYEIEGKWRFGVEGSYTGSQYRDKDTKTPQYAMVSAVLQKDIGRHVSIILNGENLTNVRQSRYESMFTGPVTSPEFKPLWAPVDGRVISFSVKFKI